MLIQVSEIYPIVSEIFIELLLVVELNERILCEPAACAKRMFWRAIAERSRIYEAFLMMEPHTQFQLLATNSAQDGHPRIRISDSI